MNQYPFGVGPKHVGGYRLSGSRGLLFYFTRKPNWFHRTMMRLCLGWEWVDMQ